MPKITVIHLKRIQIKSFEAAKRLAAAVEEIEAVCGIRVCKIKISDPFICPDLRVNEMEDCGIEGCIKDILTEIRSAQNERD